MQGLHKIRINKMKNILQSKKISKSEEKDMEELAFHIGSIAGMCAKGFIDRKWLADFMDVSLKKFDRFIFVQEGKLSKKEMDLMFLAYGIYSGMAGLDVQIPISVGKKKV